MGVMKRLNTMRMFGQNIARYERRLGLIESKPELHDHQKRIIADFLGVDQQLPLWGIEEESPVLED